MLFLIISVLFLITLIFLIKLYVIKKRIYNYDVKNDYFYNFKEYRLASIRITDDIIDLSHLNLEGQSVFIKIKLSTCFLSKYFRPFIGVANDEYSISNYFEHGAYGFRYLNISGLPASKYKFNYKYCKLASERLAVYSFENKKLGNILAIAPHPDDNEIACFSLYKNNRNAFCLNVTAGQYYDDTFQKLYRDSDKALLQQGVMRSWDSIIAPLSFGVSQENIFNLGYLCQSLKPMYLKQQFDQSFITKGRENLFRSININTVVDTNTFPLTWEQLVKDIVIIIKECDPKTIVLPDPRLDSHQDHQYTTLAVVEALSKLDAKGVKLFFYTNHLNESEFYPYGHSGAGISLPPQFDNDFYFESIYSNQLTRDTQTDKLLALQLMHDLRSGSEFKGLSHAFKDLLLKFKSLIHDDGSYFTRAVRSNELFFVVSADKFFDSKFRKDFFKCLKVQIQ